MKLKPIPNNIVIHTPTEKEAKELLTILHENGWKWCHGKDLSDISYMAGKEAIGINIYNVEGTIIGFLYIETAKRERFTILTLAEFKEKYCEMTEPLTEKAEGNSVIQQKPQPKFKVGDIAIFPEIDRPLPIHDIVDGVAISWWDDGKIRSTALFEDLEPYTEPETKEKQKEENGNNSENSQLDLCKLLKGHEGEKFYSLVIGECILTEIIPSDTFPIKLSHSHYTSDGKFELSGEPVIYPSRALYEQYPLDAKKAWEVWQDEQGCKCRIWVNYTYNNGKVTAFDVNSTFRNSSDRDKCIEEIKAIIEKYSK